MTMRLTRRTALAALAATAAAPAVAASPAPVAWTDRRAFPDGPLARTLASNFKAPEQAVAWPDDLMLAGPDGPNGLNGLAKWRGKTLLVALWAEWCAPCLAEMPSLSRLNRAYKNDRFEILPVATGSQTFRGWRDARDRLARLPGVDLPTLLDASANGRDVMMRLADAPPPPGMKLPPLPPGAALRRAATLPCLLVVDAAGLLRGRMLGGSVGRDTMWDTPGGDAFIKGLADGAVAIAPGPSGAIRT